jgi:hypothetical protein
MMLLYTAPLQQKMPLRRIFLGSLSVILFLLLLGEWQNFELIDWHLLGAGFPIYYSYKAFKSRDLPFENHQKSINER